MPHQVVVIGLDGATFTLLKPWMESGHLPYLKSLMQEGVSGPLQSSIPPVTAPAWQCFMTGKNPGKHGVGWFMRRSRNSYEDILIDPTSCAGKTIWDILSEQGKRVAVLNVPFTYPSPHLNGVLIGGFDTPPSQRHEFTYPQGLLEELEREFGQYRLTPTRPPFVATRLEPLIDQFLDSCRELTAYQFQAAHYILERQNFDFVMLYQVGTDRLQHELWYLLDPTYPSYDSRLADRFYAKILAYYRDLDDQIATLAKRYGEEATIIVISDHGFGAIAKGMDLNSWFLKEGYLEIKQQPISQMKYLLWKAGWGPNSFMSCVKGLLRSRPARGWVTRKASQHAPQAGAKNPAAILSACKRFFLSLNDVDWSKTRAYCQPGPGLIRINLAGREPQGCVRPEDYEALRVEIVAKLEKLTDPTTGQPVQGEVFLREAIYHGKFAEAMPDIVYVSRGDCSVENLLTAFMSRITFDPVIISGNHRMEGIFLAKGPTLRRGATVTEARIMDIAPLILYLMGVNVPEDMDGRVLTEVFQEEFFREHPIGYSESTESEERPVVTMSSEDQAAILERLKGLGYID